ncbi:major facilitator superfamily domain-containing protein [Talaromyces proteolyticus]|uniref:Major facilitator superfamily domain-containing protein n=1 Tax=Talaromyces proteolyticus TaxID=1131652 RepID=A0AAD4PWF4_9EURO|nr:major facilitator superfamily domain-containing protein [Talaromyces proteolyticus]KAH8691947.1 major facilitator superfamily domain-containing protein [Talaromyces proteolyticus]
MSDWLLQKEGLSQDAYGKAQSLEKGGRTTNTNSCEEDTLAVLSLRNLLFDICLLFYILNYLDRGALAFVRPVGIEDELHLNGVQFDTCLSILYVGYCLFQIPSNLILSKLKPSLYLPACMIIWGIVSGTSAAANNYASLVIIRFILGVVQAPFFPGAIFLISSWYTKKEMAMRCAWLYAGNFISNAFGSLIALGVTETLAGVHGLSSGRWLYIIEASMTGFMQAARDYRTWIISTNHIFITTGAGLVVFFPTVASTLGFSTRITYVLSAPPYLLAVVTAIYSCHRADISEQRSCYMVGTLGVALVGLIILSSSSNTAARYFSLFLITSVMWVSYNCNLAWISDCMPRPIQKKAVAIGIVSMLGQAGNRKIIAGYIYPKTQSPRYWMAATIEAVAIVLAMITTLAFRGLLGRENKRLDQRDRNELGNQITSEAGNKNFRYVL